MTIRTAILDKRFLFGDRSVYDRLEERFQKDVIQGRGAEFVAAKLQERADRHAREGDSRYRVEPNVKDGKGGLREASQEAFREIGGAYLAIIGGTAALGRQITLAAMNIGEGLPDMRQNQLRALGQMGDLECLSATLSLLRLGFPSWHQRG